MIGCDPFSLDPGEVIVLAVGSTAPAFKAKDHLGRDVALSDLRGRRVVLWFFPKADTPG